MIMGVTFGFLAKVFFFGYVGGLITMIGLFWMAERWRKRKKIG